MAFPINKEKQEFNEKFLDEVSKTEFGGFITDDSIKEFLELNGFHFGFDKSMAYIRDLEDKIGIQQKKRLKRIRNEGYLVLEPKVQVDTALQEGKRKVQVALKKTSRRLDAVNVSSFTPEQQRELLHRTAAIDSLVSIVENSSIAKKIVNRKEVELLSETAISSRKIKSKKK